MNIRVFSREEMNSLSNGCCNLYAQLLENMEDLDVSILERAIAVAENHPGRVDVETYADIIQRIYANDHGLLDQMGPSMDGMMPDKKRYN